MVLGKEALKKYADGTTYKSNGKTYKRVSFPGTKRAANYCARSSGQKQTEKVQVRRKAWGCDKITGLGAFEPTLEQRKKELKELLSKQKKALKLVDSVSSERGLAIYQSITINEQRIKAKKAYIKIAELNEKIDKVRNNREYDSLMKQREKYKKIVFNFEKGN